MNKLINGDALKEMDRMIEEGIKVDAVITDPPFNLVKKQGGTIHLFRQSEVSKRDNISKKTMSYDTNFNQTNWLLKLKKIIKKGGNIIIFNDWENMGEIAKTLRNNGFSIKQMGHWQKTNPLPSEWKRRIVAGREYYLHAIKKGEKHTFNHKENVWNGVITGGLTKGSEKKHGKHPNQKPIYLMKELIEIFTNESETVFDPFMGSGTTGVACKILNRNFIGVELDKDYYEIAKERISNE